MAGRPSSTSCGPWFGSSRPTRLRGGWSHTRRSGRRWCAGSRREVMRATVEDSTLAVSSFIRRGQEEGLISDGDPEVLAGVIRSVVVLSVHKEDIGRDIYPDVLEKMIGLVADGLTRKEKD